MPKSKTLHESNFADTIGPLPNEAKVDFYYTLARRLTVTGRSVWSDERLSEAQKLEGLMWLNEIMHRILAKADHERHQDHEWPDLDIIDMVCHYLDLAPQIEHSVLWSINESYRLIQLDYE